MSQASPNNAGRNLAVCARAMFFDGAFLGAVSIGLWAANWVVLRRVYGADVDDWGFSHFLIVSALWVPLAFTLLGAAWRRSTTLGLMLAWLTAGRTEVGNPAPPAATAGGPPAGT